MDASEMRRSFESLDRDGDGRVWAWELLRRLGEAGIDPFEPRVRAALAGARDADGEPLRPGIDQQPKQIDYAEFARLTQHGDGVIGRALNGELAVSPAEFAEFRREIEQIYADLLPNREGAVADYIPTLANADPDKFAIAICTADGQVFTIGDATDKFSVQSTSKPFNYAKALEQHGPEEVRRWVGQEQSGGAFNDPYLSLGADGRPHNPMINAGAIGTLAMVDAGKDLSARFTTVRDMWQAMTGDRIAVHGATFLAERETGFGNIAFANALANRGKLYGASPTDRRAPEDATELYTMICSLDVNTELLARAGATLASGGVAPLTGERVFSAETTGRVLSVMAHSGMYNDSGQFADQVGLPSKSGVSGNVMMVDPSRGLAVVAYSPRLDAVGNSVRGVEVCKRLVNAFDLHPYRTAGAERTRTTEADRKAEMARVIRQTLEGMARPGSGTPASIGGTTNPAAVKTLRPQPPGNQL
jgi:glutaminase